MHKIYDEALTLDTMTLADAQKMNRRAAMSSRLIVTVPLERSEIRQALRAYVIDPAFFEGEPEALAAEYLVQVLNADALASMELWALYADVACEVLGRTGTPPAWTYEKGLA